MMAKKEQNSKSVNFSELGACLVVSALRLLQARGPMPLGELSEALEDDERIFPAARENSPRQSRPRWYVAMAGQGKRFVRAELLLRDNKVWSLTGRAKDLLSREADDGKIIALLGKAGAPELPLASPGHLREPGDLAAVDEGGVMAREELQARARAGIKGFIQRMDPYEFQDLVAALLRAMGYFVASVAADKGGDGGVDIIAYDNPIGASGARLKVQVKRYKEDSAVQPKDLRELHGLLTESEAGVFVCASEFSRQCREFARNAQRHLRLIDGDEFIRLWVEFHPKMKDEDKKRLPLYAVYFLDEETIPD